MPTDPAILADLQAAWQSAGTATEPAIIPVGQEPSAPPRCRVHIDPADWKAEIDHRPGWGGRERVTCKKCGQYIGHRREPYPKPVHSTQFDLPY